jgi:FAD/FMN-containing dehydrogenase
MNVMGQIGAEMLATECQGMDPFTARARMARGGLAGDFRTLLQVVAGSGGVIAGLRNGFQIALNGRRFVDKVGYLMNCVTEGLDAKDANSRLNRARSIARAGGGREIPASIPKVLRAMPFPRMNGLLTPSGKRMNWLHVVVPNSLGGKCFQVTEDVFLRNTDLMKAHGIDRGYLLSTHGPSGVGVETLIRWSDAPYPIHTHYMTDSEKAALKVRRDDPQARLAVERLSGELLDEWRRLGGVHMQVGRKYPYLETRLPETAGFLCNLKSTLDPDGIMNPGNVFTNN